MDRRGHVASIKGQREEAGGRLPRSQVVEAYACQGPRGFQHLCLHYKGIEKESFRIYKEFLTYLFMYQLFVDY